MSDDKKITKTDKDTLSTNETISRTDETIENYEVGYGKPPKGTRFKKGQSGNPTGRPKKPLDFHRELLRKARSRITVNDNGRRVQITKLEGIALQVTNKALTGNNSAVKNFVGYYQEAVGAEALSATQKVKDLERYKDPKQLSDEELIKIILEDHKKNHGK